MLVEELVTVDYYKDCSIPLPLFIVATVKKDMQALIKSDAPVEITEELAKDLGNAWLDINSEFVEIVEAADTVAYVEEINRKNELQARILRVKVCVDSLRGFPMVEFVEALKEEDFGLTLDPTDPEQFAQDLERALVEIVADEIELEKIEDAERMEAEQNQKKARPQTEAHFDEMLLEISHREHLQYRASDLTARSYAHLLKRLKVHLRRPQPQMIY
jgi:hypothetical protein